jgi:hypothetical protein
MAESPAYLRSVCSNYAKDRKTLKQIAEYLDEPEKIGRFAAACARLFNIRLKKSCCRAALEINAREGQFRARCGAR